MKVPDPDAASSIGTWPSASEHTSDGAEPQTIILPAERADRWSSMVAKVNVRTSIRINFYLQWASRKCRDSVITSVRRAPMP